MLQRKYFLNDEVRFRALIEGVRKIIKMLMSRFNENKTSKGFLRL